jgi:hypothetical protein
VQLVGYLAGFQWPSWGIALLVAAATAGGAFEITRRLAERAVPLTLARGETADVIEDERHRFGVATLDDVLAFRGLVAARLYGRKLRPRLYVVSPRISAGAWVFSCPECGTNHWSTATPDLPTAVCSSCSGEFPARFPEGRAEIERLLLGRRDDQKRNWKPGQTIGELRREGEEAD